MIKDLQHRDDVVKLVEDSELRVIYNGKEKIGYAYLMATIGKPILPQMLTNTLIEQIFARLLNFHQAGYYHGDCRLQNLLLHDEKVIFCDFRDSMHPEGEEREQFGRDFRTLITSILRHGSINSTLSDHLANYVKEETLNKQKKIIKSLGDETCSAWKKYKDSRKAKALHHTVGINDIDDIKRLWDQTLFLKEIKEGGSQHKKRKKTTGKSCLIVLSFLI